MTFMTVPETIDRLRAAAEKAGRERDGSDAYHVLADAVWALIDEFDHAKRFGLIDELAPDPEASGYRSPTRYNKSMTASPPETERDH